MAFVQQRGPRFAYISFCQAAFALMQIHFMPYKRPAENWIAFISLFFLLTLS